jgi:hypothetical protein
MAKTSNRTDIKIPKQKPFTGKTGKAMKFVDEWVMPKTAGDFISYVLPYGKIAKTTVKAVKKVVKPSAKTKKVTKKIK